MISRVSSLVCAAAGDQLKLLVITVLLSIRNELVVELISACQVRGAYSLLLHWF